LPLIPGVDGVARLPDGSLRYFALDDTTFGAMAEQTVIDLRQSFELPEGVDLVQVAAAMNPAMSSWVGLKRRADFGAGQSVLVLGATGSSGQMAVQVAKLLGAGQVIAAGRDPRRLADCKDLGADEVVRLGESPGLGEVAADVDVVIDYLWGQVTAAEAMTAIATHRRDQARPLTWIEIGETADIPAAALRALPLQIVGSGQGSVSTRDILSELPAIAAAVGNGALRTDARAVPLSDVETVWQDADEEARIVLTP
jgi:NADPH:quinone reductase-like Zn-dependent oxidoreductase